MEIQEIQERTAEARGDSVRVCTNKITRVTLYLARNYGKQCSLEKKKNHRLDVITETSDMRRNGNTQKE